MPLPLAQYLAAVNASMSMDPGASVAQPGPQVMGLQPGPVPMDLGAMAFGGPPPTQPMGPPAAPEPGAHAPLVSAGIPGLDEKLRNGVPVTASAPPVYLPPNLVAQIAPNLGSSTALPTGAEPAPSGGPAAGPTEADPGMQAPEHPFPLAGASGGGVVPAHEQEMRGPSLRGAQGNYNQAVGEAIQAHTVGGAENAGRDYAMALEAERSAQARQMAAEQAMAEREEEMMQKQHDFSQSAKALGQFAFKPDGGFWESRTTGQKIAGVFELALNGFMAGVGRPVPSQVTAGIERSIRAQENAYHALRDGVNSQQTAFGMAMQKYQNVDAARSHVRVAALEGLQAQAMQVAALNRGNETGMRAMAAIADLEGQKMQQIAQGIRFLPAQAVGRRFIDRNTGLVYTEQEAKGVAKDWYAGTEKRTEIGMNVAGDITKEVMKGRLHQEGKVDDEAKFIAEKLQSAGVPQARAAAEQALAALNKSPGGSGDVAARWALGNGTIANKVMPDDSNAREQAYWAFANASMKAMMGNVTAGEYERAEKQLGSASDPESRRRAINATLAVLNEVEKNAKSGVSPAAQAKFDARRQAAEGGPATAPKGASKGWR